MKKITIHIEYHTLWGQSIGIVGSIAQLGSWNEDDAKYLVCENNSSWSIDINISQEVTSIEFYFFVKENDTIIRRENKSAHGVLINDMDLHINCMWQDESHQKHLHTSLFTNSIFRHTYQIPSPNTSNSLQLIIFCPQVEQAQELVIIGDSLSLGNWQEEQAIALSPICFGKWLLALDRDIVAETNFYKFAIRDKQIKTIIQWEEGENRSLKENPYLHNDIVELIYQKDWSNWKASGVAIPVFSLRSEHSFGIGEFSDLRLLIDWSATTKMRIIQILPINDTTSTYTWSDSYPYNAITIYALHPIYLGLHEYPLRDTEKNNAYIEQTKQLNSLPCVDYDKVVQLKTEYVQDLYTEIGKEILETEIYKEFYASNSDWLFPYACFCYLRDTFKTSHTKDWGEFSNYNIDYLKGYISGNEEANQEIQKVYFTQYLLHKQLTEAKEYAYKNEIVLKGDIPIGISKNSVEAWTEPHLFNLDTQTGAPPDAFSTNGQNWGFPTYNWAEMRKDNYQWWTKRFVKMADYFDAYRIDHILGFFRIWEIPETSVYGLLGYFSPALPLSINEIGGKGIHFDEQHMLVASIHEDDLSTLFGENTEDVKNKYLNLQENSFYTLKPEVDNQIKIKEHFGDQHDEYNSKIKEGLYQVCNEVLFVKDKYSTSRIHPRISLSESLKYKRLDENSKELLNLLYNDYFYHRHSQFWKEEALSKLPTLIHSTQMLVCGEDLGMVPESVPSVMKELEILSLEIQRMPKELGIMFTNLATLPYLSVSTTSSHDMSPIRMWWEEDKKQSQYYYNNRLRIEGDAPKSCNTGICTEIIKQHLASPAMLTILPLQDWLSIDESLRRENPNEERINVPSDPNHNWNYRMHLTLEKLVNEEDFAKIVRQMNEENGR